MSIRAAAQIQPTGLYISAILSLTMAMFKLTAMVNGPGGGIILPLGVFLGYNIAHILVGFICLFIVRYGEDQEEEEPPIKRPRSYGFFSWWRCYFSSSSWTTWCDG